jgi:hypothetical protein
MEHSTNGLDEAWETSAHLGWAMEELFEVRYIMDTTDSWTPEARQLYHSLEGRMVTAAKRNTEIANMLTRLGDIARSCERVKRRRSVK